MEENKSVQYTFGPEEKETLQKMATVETSVGEHIQDKRELVSTKYYSELVINTKNGPVTLNNVFITAERDREGKMSYHFRWIKENENGEQIIEENLAVDENGKVYTTGGLKDYLGDAEIDIEELMAENDIEKGRLKGISEKAEPEEMKKSLSEAEKDKDGEKQEEKQDDETNQVESDLEEQGEDLRISKYRKIKDNHVAERIPDVFNNGVENGIAYSNKLHRFVMISKVNGKYQINENVEPARMTWKTIISIGEDGEKIERKVPNSLMKTNRDDKEIAVTIGQYGDVDIETVDVLPCQERIARGVRADREGIEKEESRELRYEFDTEGKEYKHNIAHQVKNIENAQKESNQTVDYNITPDDFIPNTETTWGELMEETGESLPKLVERYNSEMAQSSGKEEPKNIIQKIIEDYAMVSHEHTRGH